MDHLVKRYTTCDYDSVNNRYYNCEYSAWDNWVRWVVLVVIIVAAFLLFFLFSCITARRRRRMGYQPYRGTGWAAGRTPVGHNAPTYNAQPYYQNQQQPYYNNSNNPPPAYTPPPNNGYYGQNDVELQQPQQAYGGYSRGADDAGGNVYAPPKGPPPER